MSPSRPNFDSARPTSIDEQEYEHVFGISVSPSPSSVSMEASSSTNSLSVSECTALSKKSTSAKRRERKKKLIAGERERAALGISSTRVFGSVSTRENIPSRAIEILPQTPKSKVRMGSYTDGHDQTPIAIAGPSTPRPLSKTEFEKDLNENNGNDNNDNDDDDDKENDETGPTRRKTRRGGKRVRRRLENRGLAKEASEVDDELDPDAESNLEVDSIADDDTTSPTSSARTSISGTPIKVTVSRVPEPEEEVDEVDGLSALESEFGTPPSKRFKGRGGVMSAEDAASSIDR